MTEITKETVTTTNDNSGQPVVNNESQGNATTPQTLAYLVYFFFGLLEILLVFRLILKLTGASPASGFVALIYSLTGLLIMPFVGIFHQAVSQGVETAAVFEPATIVAVVVYAVIAWGITQLIVIMSGKTH